MGWAFFYMFVILKIPVAFALWLVWWAVKQDTTTEEQPDTGDGGRGPDHPRPRRPRPPRRGPHAEPLPVAPKRVRVASRQSPVARIGHF
jgi:hypothetical protein